MYETPKMAVILDKFYTGFTRKPAAAVRDGLNIKLYVVLQLKHFTMCLIFLKLKRSAEIDKIELLLYVGLFNTIHINNIIYLLDTSPSETCDTFCVELFIFVLDYYELR